LSPTTVPWKLSDWKGTGIFANLSNMGIVCMKEKPWNNFADLIEDAQKLPPKSITLASIGPGRLDDLWVIEIQKKFGVDFNWVFYDGSASIQTDMMTGDIDVSIITVARADFLNHPKFKVLAGFVSEYPEGSPYRGALPTLKDFEERLGYKLSDLPSLNIETVFTYIMKADVPDEAYQALCEAVRKMCEDKEWQGKIKDIIWPSYIPPDRQDKIFDGINATIENYVDLHKEYVLR
jgi:tripartite-type tricarboxylate transporter receptor subunit TctC